jgi:hypothetical protein
MAQGAGIYSKLGGYVNSLYTGMRGRMGPVVEGGQSGYNLGKAINSTWNGLGTSNQRTLMGAGMGVGVGGLYGAASSDTSVVGGMMMGAGMGAAGGRYGGAAWKGASRGRGRGGWEGAWSGLRTQGRSDIRRLFGSGLPARGAGQKAAAKAQVTAAAAPQGATLTSNQFDRY